MILIVDSGSTKADWILTDGKERQLFSTIGFNPVYDTADDIVAELNTSLMPKLQPEQVREIHYYGTGCWDDKRKDRVREALGRLFNSAKNVVEHDLLAAARASCGHLPGIACIMGTGSNSCLYDGVSVVDNVTNLGYFLGDEGSGSHLGKMLVQAYFYRELPNDLVNDFHQEYALTKTDILDKIYNEDHPNVFLASFTKFLGYHQEHFYVKKLVSEAFGMFIDRHVRKYRDHTELPINFVGSIAYYFQSILKITLEERGLNFGSVTRKPIDPLVDYHEQAM